MQPALAVRDVGDILQFDPAHRAGSIAEGVYRTLRSSIVTLKLLPGQALSEQDIANRLNVSRQPVREAFIKLSEIGLVRVLPQRGTFVAKISAQGVLDARFVREAVECAIARRAAGGIERSAIARLQDIIDRQRAVVKTGGAEEFFLLDEAFHRDLAHAGGCINAWKVIEDAKAQMDRVRFLRVSQATPLNYLIVQHQAILDAVAARRGEQAERAMKTHLRAVLQTLPKLTRQLPDMFEKPDNLDAGRGRKSAVRSGRAKAAPEPRGRSRKRTRRAR